MFIRVPAPPKTLSAGEQARLLEVVARKGSRRDLALLTVALGTGLRLKEILGLNVGDVMTRSDEVVWKVELPKGITKGRRGGVAFLSQKVRSALEGYLGAKRVIGESMARKAPLFVSRGWRRLSLRQLQVIFWKWQEAAEFERPYNFHTLRHTAITNVDATGDVDLYSSLALDGQGNPRIIYGDNTNSDLKYASRSGGVWTPETVDAFHAVFGPRRLTSLALDAEGNPHISYHYYDWPSRDLKYASKSGGIWMLETVDATGDVGWDTSLALDAEGNPHISYYDVTNLDLKYASKSGGVWTLETVDATGWVGSHSSLTLDSQGNPRISYLESTNGYDLRRRWTRRGTWAGTPRWRWTRRGIRGSATSTTPT